MIALITPTGARAKQFMHCRQWMKKQTYTGEVLWIIVDDALPVTTDCVTDEFRENWKIVKLYPRPQWMQGQNTQSRNILAGINYLKQNYTKETIQAIFIIEDDDYYKPIYLTEMVKRLGNYEAIGETRTIYYNVIWRRFIANANTIHSSLFQTALSWDGIPALLGSLKDKFIDARFWRLVKNKYLFSAGNLAIGIKGLPGRAGIGAGHQKNYAMHPDMNLVHLKKLIGNEDAEIYGGYYTNRNGDNGQLRRPLFVKKRL